MSVNVLKIEHWLVYFSVTYYYNSHDQCPFHSKPCLSWSLQQHVNSVFVTWLFIFDDIITPQFWLLLKISDVWKCLPLWFCLRIWYSLFVYFSLVKYCTVAMLAHCCTLVILLPSVIRSHFHMFVYLCLVNMRGRLGNIVVWVIN